MALLGCATTPPAPPYETKGPIETKYQAEGPWAVTRTVSAEACDRESHLCDIWHPTELGTNPLTGARSGFRHPAISWANGSGQRPEVYAAYLKHLASWGFIVIAARDDHTRNGATTEDAARYLIAQGEASSSVFYRKVDAARLGAVGHSQGGAAITNLHVRGNPLFRTYIGFHTAPFFFSKFCCEVVPSSYEGTRVTAPIFQWTSVPDSGKPDWYDPVPNTAPKAFALLTHARHADIAGVPECRDQPCAQGIYPYLGYSTAWLMWQLQGAEDGHTAFRQSGEFFRPNANWSMNLSNLP
ncbi:hypothetical protein [Brevundimonas intermedia]|uniref:hypothetical protein n=1 Tax=Brevundimonas intermedia TaxID=74315 RepID=UPI00320ADD5F